MTDGWEKEHGWSSYLYSSWAGICENDVQVIVATLIGFELTNQEATIISPWNPNSEVNMGCSEIATASHSQGSVLSHLRSESESDTKPEVVLLRLQCYYHK